MEFPKKLKSKLEDRRKNNALRVLLKPSDLVDFCSNDYLGLAKSEVLFEKVHQHLEALNLKQNGASGSRLLTGHFELYDQVEAMLYSIYSSEAALVFNSGYDANLGFFSAVPQRHDIILYDEFAHASIRDGIQLSKAKSFKFKHNNLEHLETVLKKVKKDNAVIYVVTESVFSMDGDSPNLEELVTLCKTNNAYLIIDEAHAVGVFGRHGTGLIKNLNLENDVFARLITFGKAKGCHGAAILGSEELKNYLVNFARSFMYTTALPPHSLASIQIAHDHMPNEVEQERIKLLANIQHFKNEIKRLHLQDDFIESDSAIQSFILPGNDHIKHIAHQLNSNGYNVKPILSPTVPEGLERLRFCLHSYNSEDEITQVLTLLSNTKA